ncbi:unnamed protein product [Auanema sp. JU1783]|nr:unnamed protein product [Auanema sp. JU1783]
MESDLTRDDIARFRGLNMAHGFFKSIVKNQIDRDEYHKVMEERRREVQQKMNEERLATLRPNQNRSQQIGEKKLYIPPHLRDSVNKANQVANNERKLYIPPHLRDNHSPQPIVKPKNDRGNCSAIISEVEENNLREKIRNRLKGRMEDIDNITVPKSNSEAVGSSEPLFMLNMKDMDGNSVEVAVMNTDNAARLAKELGRKYGFNDDQCRMLRLTLDHELEKRLSRE